MATSPPQGLAGVWGAATLTSFSAIVSYMFFSFDSHSHFLWPARNVHLAPSLHGLERQCEVWQNGICWKSRVSGVSTIVEIVDLNRWVIVLVSEKTREAAETCSSVIRMILDLQHQLCSAVVTTCECLISPSLLDRYPFDALPDTDLFDLPTVARSMLLHNKLLLDKNEGKNVSSQQTRLYRVSLTTSCNPPLCASSSTKAWLASLFLIPSSRRYSGTASCPTRSHETTRS